MEEKETKELTSFIKKINENGLSKMSLSDDELAKASGGKCWFNHNYEMIYPIYYNGEYNGVCFECKDCLDFVWAKKKPFDKEYKQISYNEFMKLFGDQM